MTVANTAWDLQVYSEGRFFLGLGSQIRPHIEKRFSMPWSHPAARMKEYVLALKAIWESWMTGDRLNFRGDFYQHTLMTPFFSPGLNAFGPPPVAVAPPATSELRELLTSENTAIQTPAVQPRPAPPPKWNVFERAAYDRETQMLAEIERSSI